MTVKLKIYFGKADVAPVHAWHHYLAGTYLLRQAWHELVPGFPALNSGIPEKVAIR